MGSKRNSSKNKISYYQLDAIGVENPDGNPAMDALSDDNTFEIGGEIEDHLIISVSPLMSHRAVEELLKKLSEFVTRPIIVVTHNIHFLKARKLKHKESVQIAQRVKGQVDESPEPEGNPMGREPAKVFGRDVN